MIVSLSGMAAIDIWSIVDAVRVAKVNNLAWRDSQGNKMSLKFQPYIGNNPFNNSHPVGISFKLNF